ncbi:hypothetical protein [Niveibacterium terrae]|uniref:hypothetical protein n=1 Tax=Niveibacterium terrae TaxID=3373598 RepID=UPI003A94EB57
MGEYDLSYYDREAGQLALEIERKMVILNIDWRDPTRLRELARKILGEKLSTPNSVEQGSKAWAELVGLVNLMNVLMAESAAKDVEVHGNEAWKALARALWLERGDAGKNIGD